MRVVLTRLLAFQMRKTSKLVVKVVELTEAIIEKINLEEKVICLLNVLYGCPKWVIPCQTTRKKLYRQKKSFFVL